MAKAYFTSLLTDAMCWAFELDTSDKFDECKLSHPNCSWSIVCSTMTLEIEQEDKLERRVENAFTGRVVIHKVISDSPQ